MANRTTEQEVGQLSKLVTALHHLKASRLLELVTSEDPDSKLDPQFLPTRDIAAMGKWCLENGVVALQDAENEESKLNEKLENIRKKTKVFDFKEEMRERGLG